jgi:hypothetical protein
LQIVEEQCSEADLETFYSRYAPSARSGYTYARKRRLSRYDVIVKKEISKLTYDKVATMLSAAEGLGTEDVSHHILLVSPQNDRQKLEISIPTRYIYTTLRDHLQITTLQEASKLYQIFVRNSQTKVPAGHIFEDVHDLFCKGGQWQVTRLTQNKVGPVNTHFRSPTADARSPYMCLGYHGRQVKIKRRERPETTTFVPLVRRRYLLNQMITLENGYYQPAPGQPTFDAFIYDETSKTATMLQMTVATKHDVKTKGVEWLRNQGVENFRLVAVTPPDTLIDLPVPNTLVPLITAVCNLVLEDIL